jgi:RNA polymerase sigma-70 factor (ECF subfamily)
MGSERISFAGRKQGVDRTLSYEEAEAPERVQTVSWRRFYADNWEWIYRLVRRLGWGQLEVDDAVQDVFMVLIDKLETFEGRADLRTWIHRIAINVVYEHRRRNRRRRMLSSLTTHLSFWRASPSTPHALVESHDELGRLKEALAQLSPKKRDVFVLCAMEGLSRTEAAAILGVPEATVRTRLHYAREEVLAHMGEEGAS